MRRIPFLWSLLFLLLSLSFSRTWAISNGQRASDLLGQINANNEPVYTKGDINDGPSIYGFNGPLDVAIDTVTHRLFVTDTGNERVLVYNLNVSNTLLDRIPDNVLGQPDFFSNAPGTSANSLRNPRSIAYDPNRSRLFVSDSLNNRVLVFDVSSISNGENAVNVLGQDNFSESTATVDANSLSFPYGLAYDTKDQNLFIVDSANERIMVFDVNSITDGENAIALLGQSSFTACFKNSFVFGFLPSKTVILSSILVNLSPKLCRRSQDFLKKLIMSL